MLWERTHMSQMRQLNLTALDLGVMLYYVSFNQMLICSVLYITNDIDCHKIC